MNKTLALLFALVVSSLQADFGHTGEAVFKNSFPALMLESSSDDTLNGLRKIETISALAKTGAVVVYAIAPDFYDADPRVDGAGINLIKQLSGTVNKLASYALLEQSSIMQFTRILEAVAENASWHTAPGWENVDDFHKFASEFSIAFTRSVSTDVACYLQGQAIKAIFGDEPNRIALRAAYIVAATVTVGLLEAVFNLLDEKINKKPCSKNILRIFGEQFYRELAFHIAGELIRLGVEQGGKSEHRAALAVSNLSE